MGQVLFLDKVKNRFKFRVKVVRYYREGKNEDSLFAKAIIVLVDKSNDRCRVHEFSEFIIYCYGKKKTKTQVDYANKIVRFLNFVISRKLKNNFQFIDFNDISTFLQNIALDVNYETVERYKKVIVEFYLYLANKGWLFNISCDDFEKDELIKSGAIVEKYEIPDLEYDTSNDDSKNRNTHSMDYKLQAMFLEVAIEEVNIIAFGVALQMFGGLRVGEAINVSHSAIQCIGPFGRYGMLINIENRFTRPDLKANQGKGYSKKIRKQQVISPYGILEHLYKAHIKRYKSNNESGAVFVNKNGDAMSYDSYKYYFMKLKKIFLKRLKESNNPYLKVQGEVLTQVRWGTHIGRGIFTNNFAEYLTASELMIKRGDSSIISSSVYIEETKRIGKKYEENAENAFRSIVNLLNKGE